jgi:membrane peptidoglycan carboxypeptidase
MAALGGVLCAAMVLPVVAASGILVRNTADKVTATALNITNLPQRSAIYDRDGHLITYLYGVDEGRGMDYQGVNRQPVAYSDISQNMLQAIVAIEDDRYWQHGAIDFQGTLRAVVSDLEGNSVQGGSSIAQQYVKGVLVLANLGNPAAEQAAIAGNLSRKYTELRMALDVAHRMSKQDILAGYLNDAYFEQGAWGVEAASETYFGVRSSKLTLTQAALLAGIVENPSRYDPVTNPAIALERRNTVLGRMKDTGVLSAAAEAKALKAPLGLHMAPVQSGCSAPTVGDNGFFCDYVIHTILLDKDLGATPEDRARMLATGGLQIRTTVSPQDQLAETTAVNYVVPQWSNTYNPGHNADVEVAVTPGTGEIMAIAEDRTYGTNGGQTVVDYGVNSQYGGLAGVQTGSSSKLFTLLTALEQGVPFGYTDTVPYSTTITGYTDCKGAPAGYDPNAGIGAWHVVNASSGDKGTYSLYTGTTASINTFYARLEQKVGLCNVVKTAMSLGVTWADGRSLLQAEPVYVGNKIVQWLPTADQTPSFTLGAVTVSPLSMAAAYAAVAANGVYCSPVAISSITDNDGDSLPVPSAHCHQAIAPEAAEAANYILQGVLGSGGTAAGLGGINGYQAAGKTGTSNVDGNGTPYAAFAGYTTNLASFTSVFNPISPTGNTMWGPSACYRTEFSGLDCPGEMFGANAPGSTWHMTFDHANLGHSRPFPQLPFGSSLYSRGNGQNVVQQCSSSQNGNNNGNNNSNSCSSNGKNGKGKNGKGGPTTGPTTSPTGPATKPTAPPKH